jgi:hypothetical protein
VLLSSENVFDPEFVLVVSGTGTKSVRRHRVRRTEVGGVEEQGRTSNGRPWNTGEPSLSQGTTPETGWHRSTTSRAGKAGDGLPCDQSEHRQPCIAVARSQTKRWAEESGSLSAPIVPIERWRTCYREEPVSREGKIPTTQCGTGGRLNAGTSAWRHAFNPLRT